MTTNALKLSHRAAVAAIPGDTRMSESGELNLAKLESFYVGGSQRPVTTSMGGPDHIVADAMYVQHMSPRDKTFPLPVVFLHGGLHTGVTWETTPDGREGWQNLFVRGGFETYVIDQVSRGRSAPDLSALAPGTTTTTPTPEVAIVGSGNIALLTRGGNRFPQNVEDTYASQIWPDFGIIRAGRQGHRGISAPEALPPLERLLERIGSAILVTHSQGGDLGWKLAIACPDRVAGIVAIEPSRTATGLDRADFPEIPVYIMWGDNLPAEAPALAQKDVEEARRISRTRNNVTLDVLPEHGIFGNGHMLMMENNNFELAGRVFSWLRSNDFRA
ncbi:hypothetical protein [Rhodococcus koreensis]